MSGFITAAVVVIAGTVHSALEQRKARKERKKAAQVESRRRAIESRRATIESIEEARQMIGSIQNVAAQSGGAGGSGAAGAVGSLTTQMGANITFNQQLLQFAKKQEQHLNKAAKHIWVSQTAASFASVASMFMGSSGNSGGGS